ncbi:hypothetical protein CW304_12330 [Bacillus sp. UFRGS-B20]|nr:hypothetical protein CW304_12330 [Bacillus sp. UFRGS-B20]
MVVDGYYSQNVKYRFVSKTLVKILGREKNEGELHFESISKNNACFNWGRRIVSEIKLHKLLKVGATRLTVVGYKQ